MIEAVLLDFYGTLVHEDDVVVDRICTAIGRSADSAPPPQEVRRYWSTVFAAAIEDSHGPRFRTQRDLETESLARTIQHFGAEERAEELSEALFAHWERPPIFADGLTFLAGIDLPVIVVSNIDRRDIARAIDHHRLDVDAVLTSEDVRAYKPRPELFVAGLQAAGVAPDRALHVGDSLTGDVAGAIELGIPVAWVNRKDRPSPTTTRPTVEVSDLGELMEAVAAMRRRRPG